MTKLAPEVDLEWRDLEMPLPSVSNDDFILFSRLKTDANRLSQKAPANVTSGSLFSRKMPLEPPRGVVVTGRGRANLGNRGALYFQGFAGIKGEGGEGEESGSVADIKKAERGRVRKRRENSAAGVGEKKPKRERRVARASPEP